MYKTPKIPFEYPKCFFHNECPPAYIGLSITKTNQENNTKMTIGHIFYKFWMKVDERTPDIERDGGWLIQPAGNLIPPVGIPGRVRRMGIDDRKYFCAVNY